MSIRGNSFNLDACSAQVKGGTGHDTALVVGMGLEAGEPEAGKLTTW